MPLLWPELGPPHQVQQVYISGNNEDNTWVDVSGAIELKILALKKHVSQLGEWDPTERTLRRAREAGKLMGMDYAETFRVITLVRPETDR
jgi:hypothetical protein